MAEHHLDLPSKRTCWKAGGGSWLAASASALSASLVVCESVSLSPFCRQLHNSTSLETLGPDRGFCPVHLLHRAASISHTASRAETLFPGPESTPSEALSAHTSSLFFSCGLCPLHVSDRAMCLCCASQKTKTVCPLDTLCSQ